MKSTLARLVLGAVFLWASLDKVVHPVELADAVANYRILPTQLVNPVALGLPFVEAVCGGCLVLGFLSDSCALISGLLALSFTLATTSALWRGLDIDCGCFHSQGPPMGWAAPLLDLCLLGLAIFLLRTGPGLGALDDYLES